MCAAVVVMCGLCAAGVVNCGLCASGVVYCGVLASTVLNCVLEGRRVEISVGLGGRRVNSRNVELLRVCG